MKLSRYALVLVGLTFCLLIVGGLVHNTRSSLACPDWPLCFGTAFPKMVGGVLVEHSHRLLATTIGLGTIVLLVALARHARRTGEKLVGLGVLALGLVIAQGVLGGITVLYRLPTLVSTAHLATSMLYFGTLLYIAARLGHWRTRASSPALVRITGIAVVVVYLQMLLGALMRHLGAGLACTDLPFCKDGVWPAGAHPNVLLHAAHRLGAPVVLVVVACVTALALREATSPAKRALAILAPLLVCVQATLGWFSISMFLDVVPVTLHLGVAALLLADLWILHLLCRGPIEVVAEAPSPDAVGAIA